MYIRWSTFFAINEGSICPCITYVCDSVASSLLRIVIVKAHLPGRSLSGFSPQLNFLLLLSIPLSGFSSYSRQTLWLSRTSCTFCDILSVPQGTICGLLASRISPPLFMPLVFSTSSAGTLWVCSCKGILYGTAWSFFCSSIQGCLFLASIYLFR